MPHKLRISNDSIKFLGFDLLKQNVFFCLYPGGIVISPDRKTEDCPHCYEGKLDENRAMKDAFLVNILKERGLSNEEIFVCANNTHYIEFSPHKVPFA